MATRMHRWATETFDEVSDQIKQTNFETSFKYKDVHNILHACEPEKYEYFSTIDHSWMMRMHGQTTEAFDSMTDQTKDAKFDKASKCNMLMS
eukprot:scaffold445883_cov16-Prasinocladus_malaysianus.AAC.1